MSINTMWTFTVVLVAIITEVYPRINIEDFGTTKLLQVEKGQYVEIRFGIYKLSSFPAAPCADEEYLEIRDGYNQSANLLGVFCGRNTPYFTLRSSGHNMWLRFSPQHKYGFRWDPRYEGKSMHKTAPANLNTVAKIQFVLLNHFSSLWCPAGGGPAPRIVWRRNDAVVQNSTSVRLRVNVTEQDRNTKYSCEVDDHGQLKRINISLVVEMCPQPCQCKALKGNIKGLVSADCEGKQLKSIPKKIPRATGKLDLSNNKLQNLPAGAFSNNTKLEYLDLSKNKLQSLSAGTFNNNKQLEHL